MKTALTKICIFALGIIFCNLSVAQQVQKLGDAQKGLIQNILEGGIHGGGGDPLAIQFQNAALTAIDHIEKLKVAPFDRINFIELREKLRTADVLVVDTIPPSLLNGIKQESPVLNFPNENLILIHRGPYKKITNTPLEEPLSLHEYLSLMRLEKTGSYPISSVYKAQTTERVTSFAFHEEIGCALTSRDRVLCFATKVDGFYFANPDLLNPPQNLVKPTEIVVELGAACVATRIGIKCWGRDASIIESKTQSWKNPSHMELFLTYAPPESQRRYIYSLCASTDNGIMCTEKMGNQSPPNLRNVQKIMGSIFAGICALANGAMSCWNDSYSSDNATPIPKGLGLIKDA
ncbi:MAG: hypothetical protein KDD45_07120, partial [Bdellovibrionales bacterium]|nr:hypothetical protein [Bdellovibrionales bacterium]